MVDGLGEGAPGKLDGSQGLPGPNIADEETTLGLLDALVDRSGESTFEATLAFDGPLGDDLDELPLPGVGEMVREPATGLALARVELERPLEAFRGSDVIGRVELSAENADGSPGGGVSRASTQRAEVQLMGDIAVLLYFSIEARTSPTELVVRGEEIGGGKIHSRPPIPQ